MKTFHHDPTLLFVIRRLRRQAAKHLHLRTDYCRTRAQELRHQALLLEQLLLPKKDLR
jgi:hypothetical protein